jgi:hypothetical protein
MAELSRRELYKISRRLPIRRVHHIEISNHFIFSFVINGAFLPLVSLAHHQVEVRVNFDDTSLEGYGAEQKRINVYGNYIYLDKEERESLVKRQMDFIITQNQRLDFPLIKCCSTT